jgi:hypothetical protein
MQDILGALRILNSNGDINSGSASLIIENPAGAQSEQTFSFNGVQKASIRADVTGNLILNTSGKDGDATGWIYLNWDSGDPVARIMTKEGLIVDGSGKAGLTIAHGDLTIAGGVIRFGTGDDSLAVTAFGIKFPDGSGQSTAMLKGDTGPQGPQGPQGTPGPVGPVGPQGKAALSKTSGVCGTQPCNFACGAGQISQQVSPCMVTAETGSCRYDGLGGYCCVCIRA